MYVRLIRTKTGVPIVEGITQKVVRHSPTGFEWGYSGSGPADLALNILCEVMPYVLALQYYQRFKRDVIAKIPYEGGVITEDDVLDWLVGVLSEPEAETA